MEQKKLSYANMYKNINDLTLNDQHLHTVACLLSLTRADEVKFRKCEDLIYTKVKMFTKLKSDTRFLVALLLTIRFNEPEEKVSELLSLYELMREQRFQPGPFTLIAATIVLGNEDQQTSDELLTNMKRIYETMEGIHPFLTTTYSYPLATLLAVNEADKKVIQSEKLYKWLHLNGFRKGRDLQLLTHILLLHNEEDVKKLAKKAVTTFKQIKTFDVSTKKAIYPIIGLLSFVPSEELDVEQFILNYERFNENTLNNRYHHTNMIVNACMYTSPYIDMRQLAPIVLTITEKSIQDGEGFTPLSLVPYIVGLAVAIMEIGRQF